MLQHLERDFESIYRLSGESLQVLSGKSLLLTGGTGFFGKWLLGFFKYANTRGLNLKVHVLSRDPESFLGQHPEFLDLKFFFIKGDVRTFEFRESVDFVLHAATEASHTLNVQNPLEMFDVTVEGTKNVLRVAAQVEARRLLLISSGAVYGSQDPGISHQPDDSKSAPDVHSANSAYAEGKRVAELLGCFHSNATQQIVSFARCFAFVGAYLPLDTHFAIGNFIQDCIKSRDIVIKGDGTACRSYMYASDLVVWLLRILTHGSNLRSYNVGSEESVTIAELAREVAKVYRAVSGEASPTVKVLGAPGGAVHRYVPECSRARSELGLTVTVPLAEAIRRTFEFHQLSET